MRREIPESLAEDAARPGSFFSPEDLLFDEGFRLNRLPARPAMFRPDDEDDGFLPPEEIPEFSAPVLLLVPPLHRGDIDLTTLKPPRDGRIRVDDDIPGDSCFAEKPAEDRLNQIGAHIGGGTDAESGLFEALLRQLSHLHQAPRVPHEFPGPLRDDTANQPPLDEAGSKRLFQLADMLGNRRLGYPEPLRGGREATGIDDG